MPADQIDYTLSYPFPSSVEGAHLRLAAAKNQDAPIFKRTLVRPRRTADQLRALMTVVQARHHIPASMLNRLLRESDPIVTANDDLLRFEGFSACCGVHARVDLLPAALGPGTKGRGTTNVDFNPPMIAALARLGIEDEATISLSAEALTLETEAGPLVEKQVQLPRRWLRGLVEVQSVQARMTPVATLDAATATRLLRSLPNAASRRATYLWPTETDLRLTRSPAPNSVPAGGLERLRPITSLVLDVERLTVFADEQTSSTAWVLEFDDSRVSLTLSPDVWRGFSGEGQALTALAANPPRVAQVRASLSWGNVIDPTAIASATGLNRKEVEDALRVLGTQGLVGFDLIAQRYFHRELPFDISTIENHQPRLIAARKLVADERVRVTSSKLPIEVFVATSDVDHRVTQSAEHSDWACTCPWYARHRSSRGPCKHILAARLTLEP